jgi:hypothetical protein
LVPSTGPPSALASWVTLARHSAGFFCGRMMGALRAKLAAFGLGFFHQAAEVVPGVAGAHRVHAVHAEHGGRVHHVLARAVRSLAFLERGAGMRGQVAVARAVDEGFRQHRRAAGTGFDQQRTDLAEGEFITTPTACAWNSSCAPLASTSSSAATLNAALS